MKQRFLFMSLFMFGVVGIAANLFAQEKTPAGNTLSDSSLSEKSVRSSKQRSTINFSENGQQFLIQLNDSKVTEVYINGRKILPGEMSKYEDKIEKIIRQAEADKRRAEKDQHLAFLQEVEAGKYHEQAHKEEEQASKRREQSVLDQKRSEGERNAAMDKKKEIDEERQIIAKQQKEIDEKQERILEVKKQSELDRINGDKARNDARYELEQGNIQKKYSDEERARVAIDRSLAEADRKLLDDLISNLVEDKIADNKNSIRDFQIDESGMTLNGLKQADQLYQKYKARYLNEKHRKITYKNTGGQTTISFKD